MLGEVALYVAYVDAWSGRERVWPWASALAGLAVSVAGNVGHIQASPGVTVSVTDRLTAAASPLAAFAGLMIGFLVLKKVRQRGASPSRLVESAGEIRSALPEGSAEALEASASEETPAAPGEQVDQQLLADAVSIVLDAAASGQPVSQRVLATRLCERGHRFSNAQLRDIVNAASSGTPRAA
ncbi:MAG TPA: hypothetical protein VGG75_11525 [Trebonia sp.]